MSDLEEVMSVEPMRKWEGGHEIGLEKMTSPLKWAELVCDTEHFRWVGLGGRGCS